MHGDYDRAIELYTESLRAFPTAEAHTFLGWTYHFQGKVDEAIAECKRAIEVDPETVAELHQVYAHVEIMIERVNVHNSGEPMHVFRPVE